MIRPTRQLICEPAHLSDLARRNPVVLHQPACRIRAVGRKPFAQQADLLRQPLLTSLPVLAKRRPREAELA